MATFKRIEQFVGQRSEYPYPDENQDPKLKEEQTYYLAYAQAMISDYTNNACELPYAFGKNKRTFKEMHEYATGTYPNAKLKDRLLGAHRKKNGRYLTKMNISWDTFPVLSKFLDVMREKNMRQSYDVDASCIDNDSIQAKEADKAMLKYLVSDEAKEITKKTGFKPEAKIDPEAIGLENAEDVELFFETGGYVFEREKATIAACNKTKLVSNYKVIQDGTFDDLIKYSIGVWKYEFDKSSATVKQRRCDVYNPELDRCPLVLPYSSSNDFDNLSKCGEIRTMTVADIRREFPHLEAQQIIYLAESYAYLNPEFSGVIGNINSGYNGVTGSYNLDPINRCKILVLDYQFLGVDIENYVKNEGRTLFKSVDFGYSLTNDRKRKGDKHIQKKIVKKHSAKWVIGTDILLEYGVCEDNIYYGPDGDRCPSLDFFATKTGTISLIEKCIPLQDDIDLANIKLRNALSSAIPAPRMVIQQGLMDNVFMNGIKVQPEDNMATLKELGYLIVNAVDDDGKPIFTNQKLVDFLPMGVVEDINVFTGQIAAGINNIREILGIAQGADGTAGQKYDGAKKTELAQQSSNAALYPTFNCFQYLFESGFTHCVKMWQIVAKDRKIKLNYSPLGQKNLKVLELGKDFTNSDFNIALTLGATDEEIKQLMTDITQMKALGIQTNFQQGITTAEYLYLSETIKSGNVKHAMWVMAKIEKKKIAAQRAIDERNQQQNAADQQNSAAQAEINKQETAKVTGAEDRKTIRLQESEKRLTAAVSGMLKTFDKDGAPSPMPFFNQVAADAKSNIAMITGEDAEQTAPPQEQMDPMAGMQQAGPEIQQVA